jgi:thiol-disulfide isomerase/thioredoxin
MYRVIVGLLLLALVAACGESEKSTLVSNPGEAPYYTSLDEALKVCGENQYVAIKFWADWCTWCHALDTITLTDPVAIDYFTNDMILCKINSDTDTLLAKRFDVLGLPTTVMVNKAGEEVDRFVGFDSAAAFVQAFKDFANGIGTLQDLLTKAQDSQDRILYWNIADKYKYSGRLTEAETWYNKVIAAGEPLDSLSGQARLACADGYLRNKDYDRALAAFAQIVADSERICCSGGGLLSRLRESAKGDTAAAIAAYESWLAKYQAADSGEIDYVTNRLAALKNPPAANE